MATRALALALSWLVPASSAWGLGRPQEGAARPRDARPAAAGRADDTQRPAELAAPRADETRLSPAMGAAGAEDTARAGLPLLAKRPDGSPAGPDCPTPSQGCGTSIFGHKVYLRTTGPPNQYTDVVTVPPGVPSPYTLFIKNGEANGSHRVSSAVVKVNGVQVVGPSDLNQNVASLQRTVALAPQTTLYVRVSSVPGSYLTINLCGTSLPDQTPPQVAVAEPAPGSTTSDATPRVVVTYQDLVGPGETTASGVDLATLRVRLDGVDRTSLFTKLTNQATADIPESLALSEGAHTLAVDLRDVAGNLATRQATFSVDLSPPPLAVTQPADGALLATGTPTVRVSYAGAADADLATLNVRVDGVDRTALFVKGPSEAVATLSGAAALPSGPHAVEARLRDVVGNEAVASSSFVVDLLPPVIAIAQPAAGASLGAGDVETRVTYSDNHALDLGSFTARLDGQPVTLTVGASEAVGTLAGVSEGTHTLAVTVRDQAGHESSASVTFSVDTTAPSLLIVEPAAGALLATTSPAARLTYSDDQGVVTGTLVVRVDGVDRTAAFTAGPAEATGTLDGLGQGAHALSAEIADTTGNKGLAASAFTVDTLAPTGALTSPGALTNNPAPTVRVTYSDATSGVEPASVRLFVDGADVTAEASVSGEAVSFTPTAPLADGAHSVNVTLADRAGNAASIAGAFAVDTFPPQAAWVQPAAGAFTNDSTPELRLSYSDPSGVDAAALRVFLARGGEPESDETAWFTLGADEALGTPPAPLADGAYELRAVVADRAGNTTSAIVGFEVDTLPPTWSIVVPGAGAWVTTVTPSFTVVYQDERSGIDLTAFRFRVDGVDRTARLTVGPTQASGVLTAAEALAQGAHTAEATVFDRAGNAAAIAPQSFAVDSLAPTAVWNAPEADAYLDTLPLAVQAALADAGSGIEPTSFFVSLDGTDRTALFTLANGTATASLPAALLAEGEHVLALTVNDVAGNGVTSERRFTLDTRPPALTLFEPADGAYVRTTPVEARGSVADADPQTTVTCEVGGASVPAAVTGATWTCLLSLSEGANALTVRASDRLGHTAELTANVTLDTQAPQLYVSEPVDHQVVTGQPLDVVGAVQDASPVTVEAGGVAQSLLAAGAFTLPGVVLGPGPDVTLVVRAEDEAGNVTEITRHLRVDGVAPQVTLSAPQPGAYLRGAEVQVSGSVVDDTPVTVDVDGQPATVNGPSFSALVPVVDGERTLEAVAHDAAGNEGRASVTVTIDNVAPQIDVTAPADGTITSATTLRLTGSVTDTSPVTATLDGAPLDLAGGAFDVERALAGEGTRTFTLAAEDAAGNTSTRPVSVTVDRTPPSLQVVTPTQDQVLVALPATVSGLVSDASPVEVSVDGQPATLTGGGFSAAVTALPEGPHGFEVRAVDAAGNQTVASRDVFVDLFPPTITISSPTAGLLTRASSVTVSGDVSDAGQPTVSVSGVAATVTWSGGSGTFVAADVPLAEGDTTLTATAVDVAQRSASATVVVTRDSTPPAVTLLAPERIVRGRPAEATVTVTDLSPITAVVVRLDGQVIATLTTPPYVVPLVVPSGVANGALLALTATATDAAGNEGEAASSVRVAGLGVVVGQALSDESGLPLPGATVRLFGSQGLQGTVVTDARGRYSLPAEDARVLLRVDKNGLTSVLRDQAVLEGVGTLPIGVGLVRGVVGGHQGPS